MEIYINGYFRFFIINAYYSIENVYITSSLV